VGPDDRTLTPAELAAAVRGRDAVLCSVADRIDAAILEAAFPTCRVFANFGVGVNHIDLKAAARLGITVTHTPGVLTDATADLTWTLILATARRVPEGLALLHSGGWKGWTPTQLLGHDVTGRTLGIIGTGRIGTAVGQRAAGFRMMLLYVDQQDNATLDHLGARRVGLDECLASGHFVSLHVPLTPQTRRLIGAREFGLMRPDGILINTSRGEVVDEAALGEALRERRIAAAGLDVYEREPYVPTALLGLPNVVCLPHLGSATMATRSAMAELAAADLLRVLNGQPPRHPVRPEG
jgi:glyoxylate reductase